MKSEAVSYTQMYSIQKLFTKNDDFDPMYVSATPIAQMGLKMGWFQLGNGVCLLFNHEKGAIWQSHLAAQKEGVVTAIIFSNHKTSYIS